MRYNTTLKSESQLRGPASNPTLLLLSSLVLHYILAPAPYTWPYTTTYTLLHHCCIIFLRYGVFRKEKQDPEFQSEKHQQRSQMERLGGAERCSKCRTCVHLDGLSVVHIVNPHVKLKRLNIHNTK